MESEERVQVGRRTECARADVGEWPKTREDSPPGSQPLARNCTLVENTHLLEEAGRIRRCRTVAYTHPLKQEKDQTLAGSKYTDRHRLRGDNCVVLVKHMSDMNSTPNSRIIRTTLTTPPCDTKYPAPKRPSAACRTRSTLGAALSQPQISINPTRRTVHPLAT